MNAKAWIAAVAMAACASFVLARSASAAVADAPASQPTTTPTTSPANAKPVLDSHSPYSVAQVFFDAICDGDLATAERLTVSWDKREDTLKSLSAKLHGLVLIEAAMSMKFGQPPPRQAGESSQTALGMIAGLAAAPLDIDRGTARIRIIPQPLVLRRIEGEWRVDPRSIYANVPSRHVADAQACDRALGETAAAIAADVLAGVYPSAQDARLATQSRMREVLAVHQNLARTKGQKGQAATENK